MADALEIKLAKDQWLGGAQPSAADREAIEAMPVPPTAASHPNVFAWWCMVSKFSPTVRAQWAGAAPAKAAAGKKAEPKKEEKKAADEDDFDPFADEEEDEEAEKAKMERMKEIAKTAKSYGKVVVAKSLIIWEVKPWGEETDLDALAKKILAIDMDGLAWKTEYKKEPIAYGVFKILIGATIEDAKVSTDDVQDKIEAFEDDVQSVDIAVFNKL
jgi:elongation factor 1-beta